MTDTLDDRAWQRRWQPLLEQWTLIAARSAARPWSGETSTAKVNPTITHDPDCYLCPGVTRANGTGNPDYTGVHAIDNDFPSLSMQAPDTCDTNPLARIAPAHGHCRVLCWSEQHDATLASLDHSELNAVVELWRDEYARLAADPAIANVLIFENKGTEIGVSNLHPHGQIYATAFVTDTASRMRRSQANWARHNFHTSLLQALREDAVAQRSLVIESDEHHTVMTPFAARFAYECWIIPNRHVCSIDGMTRAERESLGRLYQRQVRRYDLLFNRIAPNVSLLHNAPTDDHVDNAHWCFHLAFHPPLREADKLKYMAGFESGANNIVNPVQPEVAASRLRDIDVDLWPQRFT